MIPDPPPPGGATIRCHAGPPAPQPKGRPTTPDEVVCHACSMAPCQCGDPLAQLIHEWTRAQGFPLPTRTSHRLAHQIRKEYPCSPSSPG